MAAPLCNDGEHVPVGTGTQIPENAATVRQCDKPARQVSPLVRKHLVSPRQRRRCSGSSTT